jgi:hypothetical protein
MPEVIAVINWYLLRLGTDAQYPGTPSPSVIPPVSANGKNACQAETIGSRKPMAALENGPDSAAGLAMKHERPQMAELSPPLNQNPRADATVRNTPQKQAQKPDRPSLRKLSECGRIRLSRLLELHGMQARVVAAQGDQLGMAAALDDFPGVHHHDDVGLFDGR